MRERERERERQRERESLKVHTGAGLPVISRPRAGEPLGWFGWQGIVPAKVEKMAGDIVDLTVNELLNVKVYIHVCVCVCVCVWVCACVCVWVCIHIQMYT